MIDENDEIAYEDDPPHPRYSYRKTVKSSWDGVWKQIGVALAIAGIVGIVGMSFALNTAISNVRETQAVLTTSTQFLQSQINDVKARQDRIEGRVYRGGQLAGDYSADERQPK